MMNAMGLQKLVWLSALIYFQESSTVYGNDVLAVKVGYLRSSDSDFYGPAINVAIEDFKSKGWLQGIEFSVSWRLIAEGANYLEAVIDLHQQEDVNVIFGQLSLVACSPIAFYASYWRVPFFSHGCLGRCLTDKRPRRTLVRTMPSETTLAVAVAAVCRQFRWSRTAVLLSPDCLSNLKAFQAVLSEAGVEVIEWVHMQMEPTDEQIYAHLDVIKPHCRIILICHTLLETIGRVMTLAYDRLQLWHGDYVFIKISTLTNLLFPAPSNNSIPEHPSAFTYLKQITFENIQETKINNLKMRMFNKSIDDPWNYNLTLLQPDWKSSNHAMLYDTVYLYLSILNQSRIIDHRNGTAFLEMARGSSFAGLTGDIVLDENADREARYWLWQVADGTNKYQHLATVIPTVSHNSSVVLFHHKVYWGNTINGDAPRDLPVLDGDLNQSKINGGNIIITLLAIVAFILVTVTVVCTYRYRRRQTEERLQAMIWKINHDDIMPINLTGSMNCHLLTGSSSNSVLSIAAIETLSRLQRASERTGGAIPQLAWYKGTIVALRRHHVIAPKLTRQDLIELRLMKEMNHENIMHFLGACVDPPLICVVTQFCSRGTLQEILTNEDIQLDWLFRLSLISDLAKGMCYLHATPLGSHGNLSSLTCLVDSRWVLKVSDFGLSAFHTELGGANTGGVYVGRKESGGDEEEVLSAALLWTAPEVLRMAVRPACGTAKGDVFSFAIILQELAYRRRPYFMYADMTAKQIIERVKCFTNTAFRPSLPPEHKKQDRNQLAIVDLMTLCWLETWQSRPSFSDIRSIIRGINGTETGNIMDNMVRMLEKYATNLEELVHQRTRQLEEEKKKTDVLLYKMLPASVADKLKGGKQVSAELYHSVSVYFSDIVHFTEICSGSSPIEVVNMLNDLYTVFDSTIAKYDVYKIETIGDAYMVASGLPMRNGDRHASEIANMALDLVDEVSRFRIAHRPDSQLDLRIGVHTGSCAAGVVGLTMPRYCLFGDTVNTASRMESTGAAGKIHISEDTFNALRNIPIYKLTLRGKINVKGKGQMATYWLEIRSAGCKEDT